MDSAWSTDTEAVQYRVYIGIWTNWSKGRVLGSTLTLSRENGNLLIAFTAFFVSLVATRLWRIACLGLHHSYSSLKPQDGLYHQRQAILRNSASPVSSLFILGQLYLAWRKSARSPFLRTLPTVLFAIGCVCAFAFATGFSSQVSSAISNDVLVDGSNCTLLFRSAANGKDTTITEAETAKRRSKAVAYSQQCYPSGNGAALAQSREIRTGTLDCASYVIGRIPAKKIDANAPCPFGGDICVSNMSNILLDTGLIDSHAHIGLNAPPNQRYGLRQVLHCAPLRTEGYTRHIRGLHSNYTTYHYGHVWARNTSSNTITVRNRTLQVEDPTALVRRRLDDGDKFANSGTNFRLDVRKYFAMNNGYLPSGVNISSFTPVQDLRLTDGDTSVVFLMPNGVYFSAQTNDPWYRADTVVPEAVAGNNANNESVPLYYSTEGASPMGCVEQYQFCTTASLEFPVDGTEPRCGPLDSLYNAANGAIVALFNRTNPEAPDIDVAYSRENNKLYTQFVRFVNTLILSTGSPAQIPEWLGAASLASQQTYQTSIQWGIPDDQWKRDVVNWWSIYLAGIQTGFVDAAIGFGKSSSNSTSRLERYALRPENDYQRAMCASQKVRSTRYTSFSMFGLCFIFAVGTLIMIISYSLEPILELLAARQQKKYGKNTGRTYDDPERAGGGGAAAAAYKEWVVNDTLHLQQLSFQGLGRGTWSGCANTIPVTKPGEMLKSLVLLSEEPGEKDSAIITPQTTTEGGNIPSILSDDTDGEEGTNIGTETNDRTATTNAHELGPAGFRGSVAVDSTNGVFRHGTYGGTSKPLNHYKERAVYMRRASF